MASVMSEPPEVPESEVEREPVPKRLRQGWLVAAVLALAVIAAGTYEAIGFIRSSTQKMDRLINAILRLSREGRRTLTPEPLDLSSLVDGILQSLQHRVQETGTAITVDPLPTVVSDRLAIEQILSNLIENAIKYLDPSRPGEIRISGSTERGRVIVEVADNGRGIDPRDHGADRIDVRRFQQDWGFFAFRGDEAASGELDARLLRVGDLAAEARHRARAIGHPRDDEIVRQASVVEARPDRARRAGIGQGVASAARPGVEQLAPGADDVGRLRVLGVRPGAHPADTRGKAGGQRQRAQRRGEDRS